ncbi:hypothetical protein ACPF8X_31255 [Streptomyces sp. G35A]
MVGFNLAVLAAERTAEPAVPGVFAGCAPVVVAVLLPLLEGRRPRRTVLYGASAAAVGAFTVQGWGRTDGAGLAFSLCALIGEVGFAVPAVPVPRSLGPVRCPPRCAGSPRPSRRRPGCCWTDPPGSPSSPPSPARSPWCRPCWG